MSKAKAAHAIGTMYYPKKDGSAFLPVQIEAKNVAVLEGKGSFAKLYDLQKVLDYIESSVPWKIKGYVDAPPLPTGYEVGDILIDKTPTAGGNVGWILCLIEIGKPATAWYPWGVISKV